MRQFSSPGVLPAPLLAALCGATFCVWSALGNGLNLCVTHGCTLYQDAVIGGFSLWWLGFIAFAVLALVALMGRPGYGVLVSGLCLAVDVLLLLLMVLTAPCVSCLLAALFFALCYGAFRQKLGAVSGKSSRSWLLWVWAALMCVNVGAVLKAQAGPWCLFGPEDAGVRVYFSPSCQACRETVTALSGKVNVAFYPVAEEYADVLRVAVMQEALDKGQNMAEALLQAQREHPRPDALSALDLDNLLLWFRITANKAHVLEAGSPSVPFIEYQGMPAALTQRRGQGAPDAPLATQDATLPLDTEVSGSCGRPGSAPCPDAPAEAASAPAPDEWGATPAPRPVYGPMRRRSGTGQDMAQDGAAPDGSGQDTPLPLR